MMSIVWMFADDIVPPNRGSCIICVKLLSDRPKVAMSSLVEVSCG